jgi:hypothetical protein
VIIASKQALYEIPVASTSFLREAYWDGATSSIRFAYELEYGETPEYQIREVQIKFRRPMLLVTRAESFCRVEHIEGCYDTLVEVTPSAWLQSEYTEEVQTKARMKELHHYMIYLDSVGCFELLAESFTVDERAVSGSEVVQ